MHKDDMDMFLCMLDFEATCDANPDFSPQEIIEFPVILYNATKQEIVDEFHFFCRPQKQPKLTEFCKQLTGITQQDVDKAMTLNSVLTKFDEWLAKWELADDEFAFVTCGTYDLQTLLPEECKLKKIAKPSYFDAWINIKEVFQKAYKNDNTSVVQMMDYLSIEPEVCQLTFCLYTFYCLCSLLFYSFRDIWMCLFTDCKIANRKEWHERCKKSD